MKIHRKTDVKNLSRCKTFKGNYPKTKPLPGKGLNAILTELRENENNFVVILTIIKSDDFNKLHIDVNSVRSIYPKDKKNGIIKWINSGLMKWVDKKKALDFISNSSTPANVGYKAKSISCATNINKNFGNS